jgi:hypothetical protein
MYVSQNAEECFKIYIMHRCWLQYTVPGEQKLTKKDKVFGYWFK